MKPFRFLPFVLLLAACGAARLMPGPATIAVNHSGDEAAAVAIERAYHAAARLLIEADRAGVISKSAYPVIAAADRRAYAAVTAARAAYEAGNAPSYPEALRRARFAVAALVTAMGR